MNTAPQWSWWVLVPLVAVLGVAGGARVWYLLECAAHAESDAAFEVQGRFPLAAHPEGTAFRERARPTQLDELVANVSEQREFRCRAPLSDDPDGELTAHLAPGYPLLHGTLEAYFPERSDWILRWLQCILGTLTAGCYFLLARRAFHSTLAGFVAGLLTALHPFWIVNTGELNDGVLVSFLVALSLLFGTRGMQQGGAFIGLLLGFTLAAMVLVRAALVPFAIIALLAFLWQCRRLPTGWLVGFLALFGFVNGVGLWSLRNYQAFERPIPIADSTYLHLWMGNNTLANGAEMPEGDLRASLKAAMTDEQFAELMQEPNQAVRYQRLAPVVWHEVQEHPTATIARRIRAGLVFLLGERWFTLGQAAIRHEPSESIAQPPDWLRDHGETILQGTLLGMFVLAFLGWRWSAPWRRPGRLLTIATLWIPLPYLLTHAEHLAGPRLPLDGVLLSYSAFALVSFLPGVVQPPQLKKDDASR